MDPLGKVGIPLIHKGDGIFHSSVFRPHCSHTDASEIQTVSYVHLEFFITADPLIDD